MAAHIKATVYLLCLALKGASHTVTTQFRGMMGLMRTAPQLMQDLGHATFRGTYEENTDWPLVRHRLGHPKSHPQRSTAQVHCSRHGSAVRPFTISPAIYQAHRIGMRRS